MYVPSPSRRSVPVFTAIQKRKPRRLLLLPCWPTRTVLIALLPAVSARGMHGCIGVCSRSRGGFRPDGVWFFFLFFLVGADLIRDWFLFSLRCCRSASQARLSLDAGSRARRRDTFLCSAKEKYPKERRPEGLPATRVPCASRENRRLLNSRSRYARTLKHTQASSGFHCDARLHLRELKIYPSRSTDRVPLPIWRLAATHRLAVIQPGRPLCVDGDVNAFIACLCLQPGL
jgi:hypothetical protein